jgi:hypothetical protein
MKKASIFISVVVVLFSVSLFSVSLSAAPKFTLKQLQGAWWSDPGNPTADFAIHGDQVWLDFDSGYHPCKIEGDILIFELGPDIGSVKNKIISVKGDRMVLESVATKERRTLTRVN